MQTLKSLVRLDLFESSLDAHVRTEGTFSHVVGQINRMVTNVLL